LDNLFACALVGSHFKRKLYTEYFTWERNLKHIDDFNSYFTDNSDSDSDDQF